MKKVICLFLGFLLIASGCSDHISDHCLEMSAEIALPTELRENYNPIVTPITDIVGECYCHVEDAALVVLVIALIVGLSYAGSSVGGS
jgi:hypothetical protein